MLGAAQARGQVATIETGIGQLHCLWQPNCQLAWLARG